MANITKELGFEIFTASAKSPAVWNVMPSSETEVYLHFQGNSASILFLDGFVRLANSSRMKIEDSKFLRNVG
jgi:hypothetical protein